MLIVLDGAMVTLVVTMSLVVPRMDIVAMSVGLPIALSVLLPVQAQQARVPRLHPYQQSSQSRLPLRMTSRQRPQPVVTLRYALVLDVHFVWCLQEALRAIVLASMVDGVRVATVMLTAQQQTLAIRYVAI